MRTDRFLYEAIPGRPSCHAGTLAELPGGGLLAAFYAGTHEGHSDVALLTACLPPGADAWRDVRVVVDTPGKSEGNPVLHMDAHGLVTLFFVTQQQPGWNYVLAYAMTSRDQGRTWSEPRLLSTTQGWMVRNKPIRLRSGRTVLPCYDEITWRSFCLLSEDEGATWRQSGWLEGPCQVIQPTLLERRDGSILALMRSGPPADRPDWRRLWRSESCDGGETWSPCEPTELPNPDSACDLAALGDGRAVLIFNDTPQGRTPLSAALSFDEGRAWPLRRALETDADEFSYPAVIRARDGLIHTLYTWRRSHMKHMVFDEAWVAGE